MSDRIEVYLNFCQSKWWFEEHGQRIPPTAEEARLVIQYFRDLNLRPAIVGTAAVYQHDTRATPRTFRPGARHEVFLHSEPGAPPPPWKFGEPIALAPTWLSETEGHLNLLVAGAPSPDGGRYPKAVVISPDSDDNYPVAVIPDLIRLMLASMDIGNMPGIVSLIEIQGHFPTNEELGELTTGQTWCLDWLRKWWNHNRKQ